MHNTLYAADNQSANVPAGGGGTHAGVAWTTMLRPYGMDQAAMLVCPETVGGPIYGPGDWTHGWGDDSSWYWGGPANFNVGYGYNNWLNPIDPHSPGSDIPKLTAARSSLANVPALADGVWESCGWPDRSDTDPGIYDAPFDYATDYNWVPYLRRFCIDRHSFRINTAFLDTHVQTVGIDSHRSGTTLWDLYWHNGW